MPEFTTKPLDESTWPEFARLVERDGGIWGGCWCISFHLDPAGPKGQCQPYRETKERLVREGRAQATLVFDGEEVVGWCQFGPPHELRNIKHRKQYEKEHGEVPDWRITCFYVGKGYRKRGVANLALSAALKEIARLGGGVVEAYPEDVEGRKTSSSFLHGGTLKMFEREGFERVGRLGMHHWIVRRTVRKKRA
jgi:ribosomal protein S18 acetylase RimI-like enzyme